MEQVKKRNALFWFRRDLRIHDNTGLYYALKECDSVAPIFIFDKSVLEQLPSQDKRIDFIWKCIATLKEEFRGLGSDLIVKYGYAESEIVSLAQKYHVDAIYANEEYEPKTRQRDAIVAEQLQPLGIEFKTYKDNVIFSPNQILNNAQQPYVTYSQYKTSWKKKISSLDYKSYQLNDYIDHLAQFVSTEFPTLESMGFDGNLLDDIKLEPGSWGAQILFQRFKEKIIPHYKLLRDIPFSGGVSYLSVHNRLGTISIRYLISEVMKLIAILNDSRKESCEVWLDELIWREYYVQLMYHFPKLAYEPFKSGFEDFPWENNPHFYLAWCNGKTGYPLVDAAMIQLNTTGYMHNRLRMLVASFFTKHLLIDYKLGEDYFAAKLLDFDLSANNGGWQWAASTGCEAQSYLRIFNPVKQSEKFDTEARFIKKYLPIFKNVPAQYLHEPWLYEKQLNDFGIKLGTDYPVPIVDHEERRKNALQVFNENFRLEKYAYE